MRDRKTLLILFGMPVAQVVIFGFALTNEVRNAGVLLIDHGRDEVTRTIIGKLRASDYFTVVEETVRAEEIDKAFRSGRARLAIVFPAGFGEDLVHLGHASIQIVTDASDPNAATTLAHYFTQIVNQYQRERLVQDGRSSRATVAVNMLYNPQLRGAHNFVPGVMALVLMLVCVMMTSVSIVREKETGTMEVLLVSPFRPELVIISKAVPYLLLSLINIASILLLSVFVLGLPVEGNLVLLFAVSVLFILTCLSLGLLVSVLAKTQETAMLVSLLGMFLPTLLFSGFMFPIENMPLALQYFSDLVPAKWYYVMVQDIMLKGVGIEVIWQEVLILMAMTIGFLVVSLRNFKIRLA